MSRLTILFFVLVTLAAHSEEKLMQAKIELLNKTTPIIFEMIDVADYCSNRSTFDGKKNLPSLTGVFICERNSAKSKIGLAGQPHYLLELDGVKMTTVNEVVNWFKAATPGKYRMKVLLWDQNEKSGRYYSKTIIYTFSFTELVSPVPAASGATQNGEAVSR